MRVRRPGRSLVALLQIFLCASQTLNAQVDLLPVDHPATETLLRLSEAGIIPAFPSEHLPISRRDALRWIEKALATSDLQGALRDQANYYHVELQSDVGEGRRDVVIPIGPEQETLLADGLPGSPFTGVLWVDTARDSRVALDPILDGEIRVASGDPSGTVGIFQGGVRLRGSVRSIVGFSGAATNGTVVGDEAVALDDPRYGATFKFGQTGLNRDIDFGSGHLRFDIDGASLGIAREKAYLGLGGRSNLLFGGELPSNTDWIRLGFRVGSLDYTHLHASLMADAPEGAIDVGPLAEIPPKYVAAHLLSVGPIGPVRLSVGEAVVYGGRPFEIGYLNPLNFLKSQEHFLRDRDNSMLYAALRVWPVLRLRLEGEFLLDDLVFSRIGTGYWGNKTAWRVGAGVTGLPLETTDVQLEYTRLEPYVYSHFFVANAYLHDGGLPAAGGGEPNSHTFRGSLSWRPIPNFVATVTLGYTEHGRNVTADTGVVRNVGGDVREGFRTEVSADTVEFLDGIREEVTMAAIDVRYEIFRNIYLRLHAFLQNQFVEGIGDQSSRQVWFGMRVGVI